MGFRKIMLNKTDVEILWTLKLLSKNSTKSEIVKNNDKLTFNDKFRLRLLFLKDNDFVEMESVQDYGVHYRIKTKSLDLLWSDVTRRNLLNLIQVAEYTLDEIMHFVDDTAENIHAELSSLENCNSPMVEFIIINEEKKFRLTSIGEQYIGNNIHAGNSQENDADKK
jgi:hypothetical protein